MSSPHEADTPIDIREHGAARDGVPQILDRRLFMQLLVFTCPPERKPRAALETLSKALAGARIAGVLYEDVNDPFGFGLLTFSEDPEDFVKKTRPLLQAPELAGLRLRPDFTMIGRSYSNGYEMDLEYWLLRRPRETVLNETWPWAVWYPLKRTGAFSRLEKREQGSMMREHGAIGRSYAGSDLAHDVRLACHGLDANDNDFVIGLIGKELYPLSHVVQSMRTTRQTAEFMEKMGPFFVGHAVFRNAG